MSEEAQVISTDNLECPFCGFVWTPRVENPRACPGCKKYFNKLPPIPTSKPITRAPRKSLPRVDALSEATKATTVCERCQLINPLDSRPAEVNFNGKNLCIPCLVEVKDE